MKVMTGSIVESESDRAIHLGKHAYQFSLETVSTLNMGGYDANDFTGDIYWYDASACVGGWNQTATGMWIDDTSILPVLPDPTPDPTPDPPSLGEETIAYPETSF